MAKTILLVEDNQHLNEINRRALKAEGYTVLTAMCLAEARTHLEAASPDAILLDVLLPDGNGIDFCDEIRAKTDAHILFLTSRGEHEDRIRGLDSGGDDYITKPYKLEEMLSRVRAAMRRRGMRPTEPQTRKLDCGPLRLDMVTQRAYLSGDDLQLTPKEFILLLMLTQNEGTVLSKELLYETAWGAPMGGDGGALWRQMSALKRKLGENNIELVAERGQGYMLKIL